MARYKYKEMRPKLSFAIYLLFGKTVAPLLYIKLSPILHELIKQVR